MWMLDLAAGAAQAVPALYLVAPDAREDDVRKQLVRPAFRRIGDLSVKYLPYSELERNRHSMARFGEGPQGDRRSRAGSRVVLACSGRSGNPPTARAASSTGRHPHRGAPLPQRPRAGAALAGRLLAGWSATPEQAVWPCIVSLLFGAIIGVPAGFAISSGAR
jgi:hypothetical protein